MLLSKTSKFISILLLISFVLPFNLMAEQTSENKKKNEMPLLSGIGVGVDLCGLMMKALNTRFANMEVMGRIGLKEKYFPVVELGIGDCTKSGGENSNTFSTTSPYFRIGADYNVNKKFNGNRFLVGMRYGFSNYKYDFTCPDYQDPVYQIERPLNLEGLKGKNQWMELVVGFETKLWSIVRLGYNVRYKFRVRQSVSDMGEPYFVPGFGRNDSNTWGGSVNLTFDVGKTAKKNAGKSSIPTEVK